jgi:hypothetical protein
MGLQVSTAMPLRCSTHVERFADELALRRRTGSSALGTILLLWLTGWTVGCVHLAVQALERTDPISIIIGCPFWSAWIIVACVVVYLLFGTEELRLDKDGFEYRRRAVVGLGTRRVPLEEFRGIIHESKVINCDSQRAEHGLRIDTAGRPVCFGFGVETQERLWLAEILRQHLEALRPGAPVPVRCNEAPDGSMSFEPLKPREPEAARPSDSRLKFQKSGDRTVFIRTGTFSPAGVGLVTFLCVFWNGVTGGFVVDLIRHFAWDEFFFLIPFEGIGLALIVAWFCLVLAPVWKRTWEVDPRGVDVRWSVVGVGWTTGCDDWQPGRVEMRRRGRESSVGVVGQEPVHDPPFSVALIGHDGRDRLSIDGLSEGEARWIGAELCRSVPVNSGPVTSGPDSLYDRWVDSPGAGTPDRMGDR